MRCLAHRAGAWPGPSARASGEVGGARRVGDESIAIDRGSRARCGEAAVGTCAGARRRALAFERARRALLRPHSERSITRSRSSARRLSSAKVPPRVIAHTPADRRSACSLASHRREHAAARERRVDPRALVEHRAERLRQRSVRTRISERASTAVPARARDVAGAPPIRCWSRQSASRAGRTAAMPRSSDLHGAVLARGRGLRFEVAW